MDKAFSDRSVLRLKRFRGLLWSLRIRLSLACLKTLGLVFVAFLQGRNSEPALTGCYGYRHCQLIASTLFWREVGFMRVLPEDDSWTLAA